MIEIEEAAHLIDGADEGARKKEHEREFWKTILLDDILLALETASEDYEQCYDFRTNQTLWIDGYTEASELPV